MSKNKHSPHHLTHDSGPHRKDPNMRLDERKASLAVREITESFQNREPAQVLGENPVVVETVNEIKETVDTTGKEALPPTTPEAGLPTSGTGSGPVIVYEAPPTTSAESGSTVESGPPVVADTDVRVPQVNSLDESKLISEIMREIKFLDPSNGVRQAGQLVEMMQEAAGNLNGPDAGVSP